MERETTIYLIKERGTEGPVYVGRTYDIVGRLKAHAASDGTTNIEMFMQDPDREFEVTILEVIPAGGVWRGREEHWRQTFEKAGVGMLNMIVCGDAHGEGPSQSLRLKCSRSQSERGGKGEAQRKKIAMRARTQDRSSWKKSWKVKSDERILDLRVQIPTMWAEGTMTQGQIAARLGITQDYVSRVLRGHGSMTTVEKQEMRNMAGQKAATTRRARMATQSEAM